MPLELRRKIYTCIFEDSCIALAISRKPLYSTRGAATILRVCHFLRAEALSYCYELAYFTIESENHSSLPIRELFPSKNIGAFDLDKIQRVLIKKPVPIKWGSEPVHSVFTNLRYVALSYSSHAFVHRGLKSSTSELLASEETRCVELGNVVRCNRGLLHRETVPEYLSCVALNDYVRRYYSGPVGARMALCAKLKPHPRRAEQKPLVCDRF
jgi:hypothetical protein